MKHFARAAASSAVLSLALPFLAAAQHFSQAYIDIRLVKPDSVHVTVEADRLDFKNAVWTFPAVDDPPGSGMESFRRYEQRIEAYLQQKVKIRVDGKPVNLSVVAWKPGGKNRDDRFDTVSVRAANHAITLGGRLPPGARSLQAWSELWVERPELVDDADAPAMDYHLFDGDITLRRVYSRTERWVRFPVSADSLARMRKSPMPTPHRAQADHTGHNH